MKKLLLSFAALATVFAASASRLELAQLWENSVSGAYPSDKVLYDAKVAVDPSGNVIASGAYSQDFTLGTTLMEAVGTGSYLAKYNPSGALEWAVSFSGSASVVAIDTDDYGDIYVAGRLADEVTFGTTSGAPVVKEGLMLSGAPVSNQDASFIAKYSASGEVQKVEVYAPVPLPELEATGMYYPMDGDIFFHLTDLKVVGSKVYASAVYTDQTTIENVRFTGSYNDPWGGVYYVALKSASVFSLDLNFTGCIDELTCSLNAPLATEDDSYQVGTVDFAVDGSDIYAVFTGNGPLVLRNRHDIKVVEAEPSQYNYILAHVASGPIAQFATLACPEAGFNTNYVPAYVAVKGTDLYVVGDEPFAENYGEANERISNQTFVITAPVSELASAQKKTRELINGDITYYAVASAAILPSGGVFISTLGYYNTTAKDGDTTIYSKGDFAGRVSSCVFADGSFEDEAQVSYVYGVAAAGDCVAFARIFGPRVIFGLYRDRTAGISDITADDADSPVEYFNLQGVRIDNPASGLFIRRQGTKTTKVIVK